MVLMHILPYHTIFYASGEKLFICFLRLYLRVEFPCIGSKISVLNFPQQGLIVISRTDYM